MMRHATDPARQQLLPHHRQMFQQRPQRQSREVAERRNDQGCEGQQNCERPGVRRQRAGAIWRGLLGGEQTCQAERWNRQTEAADHHRDSRGQVVKHAVGVKAGKVLTVVGIGRSIGEQDFGEAVRAGIGHQSGESGFGQHSQRCE